MSRMPPSQAQQLVISSVAISGAYGDHPTALFAGISTRLSCRSSIPGLQVNGPDQTIEIPYWAASDELPAEIPTELRLQILCQGALVQLPPLTDPAATLIVNLLPDANYLHDPQRFKDSLAQTIPTSGPATVLQEPCTPNASAVLTKVLEDFRHGPWQQLIFGGADCLIDSNMVLAALQERACCSDQNPDRRLLGEGAAYLVIDKVNQAPAGAICLGGLAQQEEPNHGQAASKVTSALASSITTAVNHAGLTVDDLDGIISGYVPDLPGTLEWDQTERKLWPETSRPLRVEELNPQLGSGDCGSASLPLALALAHARFAFTFAPVTTLLVCDISQRSHRGAICLERVC